MRISIAARSCPHVKHGGRVEVRAIADVRAQASAAQTAAESFQPRGHGWAPAVVA